MDWSHCGLPCRRAVALRAPRVRAGAIDAPGELWPPVVGNGKRAAQNTVQAMVQTRDGFIWLGTEVGLVRFDGNSFQTFDRNSSPALPGNDVRCLLATSDGALWIGTSDGLARWKDGAVTAFTTKDGLPGNNVERILETSEGELWVNTDQGLARFTAEGFAHRGGLPEGPVEAISLDDGTLWVDTPNGSFVRRKGAWNIPSIAGLPQSDLNFM